jgi:hypothetical protein
MSSTPSSTEDGGEPETVEPDTVRAYEGFSGPFFRAIGQRKRKGRDAKILVTAKDAQTGVGKSNLCDFLGYALDTSESGFSPRKVVIEPGEFIQAYNWLSPGSALVMEEGEQLDSRRAMSKENVESSQKWQEARVREVIALINLPSPDLIDKRMERISDFWIHVQRRGRARIYRKRIHSMSRNVYFEVVQDLEWPNMDGSETFQEMAQLKDALLDGDVGSGNWVPPDEHNDAIEKARKETKAEVRDTLIQSMYNQTELTAPDIASLNGVDISAGRVRQIGNNMT